MVRRSSDGPGSSPGAGSRRPARLDTSSQARPAGRAAGVVLDEETRAYVRTLALSLARGDQSLADDVEQETLVAALQSRPKSDGALRSWLRSVAKGSLRNVLGRGRRNGVQLAAYDEAVHSRRGPGLDRGLGVDPAESGVRHELGAALGQALARLPERYARVITMRVVDGQPPREIAEELGVPVNTVRTWTRRGFAQLREDAECLAHEGEAPTFRPLMALAGLIPWRRGRLAAVVAAPVLVAGVVWWGTRPKVAPAAGAAPAAAADATEARADLVDVGQASRRAVPLPVAPVGELPGESLAVPSAPVAPDAVRVRVRDLEGRPVPGVDLFEHVGRFGAVRPVATTDGAGEALVVPAAKDSWIAARGGLGQVSAARLVGSLRGADAAADLVLEPTPYAWVGVDLTERPELVGPIRIEGTPQDVRLLSQFDPDGALVGSSCWLPPWRGSDGRFAVPTGDVVKSLVVLADELPVARTGPVRLAEAPPATITVRAPWSASARLVTEDGVPLAHEAVRVRARMPHGGRDAELIAKALTTTDADGRVEFSGFVRDSVALEVRGRRVRSFPRPVGADSIDVGDIVVAALEQELSLGGRVVGAEGPFRVQAVTSDWRRAHRGHELVGTRTERDSVVTDAEGRFVLPFGGGEAMAILVLPHPDGTPIAPTRLTRPAEGWGSSASRDLWIDVDPKRAGRIHGVLGPGLEAGWAQLVHEDMAHRVSVRFAGDGRNFASPLLGPGRWRLEALAASGGPSILGIFEVVAGEELRLGELRPKRGAARIQWPSAWSASSAVRLSLLRRLPGSGTALVMQRRVHGTRLDGEFAELQLEPGAYTLDVYVEGARWSAGFPVHEGGIELVELAKASR